MEMFIECAFYATIAFVVFLVAIVLGQKLDDHIKSREKEKEKIKESKK